MADDMELHWVLDRLDDALSSMLRVRDRGVCHETAVIQLLAAENAVRRALEWEIRQVQIKQMVERGGADA